MKISVTVKDQNTFEAIVTNVFTTTHIVSVSDAIHDKLTKGKISKETLLEKSFEFLLERELNTSILSQFDIEVIAKYFPDYESVASNWSK